MKLIILNALKAKFTGVNDNILNRIAEKLAKTVTQEADVAAAVEAVTFQQVIDGEADRRATDATQTAVTNYEKKHGLKDGQKAAGGEPEKDEPTQGQQQQAQGGDLSAIVSAAVTSAVKPLQDEINTLKLGKVVETRTQKLNAVIEKLPDSLKKPYSRISIDKMTDEEFDTFVSETTTEVEGVVSEYSTKGAVFNTPLGGSVTINQKEPTKDEIAAVRKGLNF
jgi:hypothetical protein